MILPDTLPGPARRYLGHLETAARSLEWSEDLADMAGPVGQKRLTMLLTDFVDQLVENVLAHHRAPVEPVQLWNADPEEDDAEDYDPTPLEPQTVEEPEHGGEARTGEAVGA